MITDKKIWRVEVDGRQHVIEVQLGTIVGIGIYGGQLLIDGKVIDAWGSDLGSVLPAKVEFQIDGRWGIIRRRDTVGQSPVLYFDGKKIRRGR